MILKQKSFIQSDALNELDYVSHGFFGRDYNIASYQDANDCKQSYNAIARHLGLKDMSAIKAVSQIHSDKIIPVTSKDNITKDEKADGLITDIANIGLAAKGADCPPVLFAARTKKLICAVHAGWRGAFDHIHINALNYFKGHGIAPKDIIAVIGPAITQKSYEVDQGFMDNFLKRDGDYGQFFIPSQTPTHHMFDLCGFIAHGLMKENVGTIDTINIDTYSNHHQFFSHRKMTHEKRDIEGRHLAVIAITSQG